jgi:hypothetical protein
VDLSFSESRGFEQLPQQLAEAGGHDGQVGGSKRSVGAMEQIKGSTEPV